MSDIQIHAVQNKSQQKQFLDVAFEIYKSDPNWIAPLYLERFEHLDPKKNPYFEHGEAQLFVAFKDGRAVGRISAQIDQLHLARHKDDSGQFGFLDAVDDPEVFAALTNAAEDWLRQRGMKRVRGPFSFSINDEMGMLVDGFDTPPYLFMAHSLPYASKRIEALGYQKAKDVFAYDFHNDNYKSSLLARAYKRALANPKLTVRAVDKSRMEAELAIIMDIFNDAWSENWGFIPFTAKELSALAKNLKMLVTNDYAAIAYYEGEPAAMVVTLPNVNEWIAGMNGKLFPFNWLKLIPKVIAKKPKGIRLPLMGVRKKFHDSALGSTLAIVVIEHIRRFHTSRGTMQGELGWILEDNVGMRNIVEATGAKAYKTYRIYEKLL